MKKFLASILVLAAATFGVVNFSAPAYSACPADVAGINTWCNGLDMNPDFTSGADSLRDYIIALAINILNMLIDIANYVAVLMVMYGGFIYLTSGSNEQQLGKGKKIITNAAIGVAIMTASSAVIGFVRQVTDMFKASVEQGFVAVANKAFIWAGILAILMIVWGAVQYTTSAGDPGKIQKSKKTIINSLIGVIIVVLAAAIVNLVINQAGKL